MERKGGKKAKLPIEGEVIRNKGGRPSKYEPWMCDKIIELAHEGAGQLQMCAAIGISSKSTWANWKERYPEFHEAAEAAKIISGAYDENTLRRHLDGEIKSDSKALMWSLYNKCPDFYQMPNQKNVEATNITVNNLQLSSDEIDAKLKTLEAQMKALNYVPDAE